MIICEFGGYVSVPPTMGGEVFVYQVSRELSRRGHEVHLFVLGDSEREDIVEGIHVHYVPQPWVLRALAAIKPLEELVHSLKIDFAFKLAFCLLPGLTIAAWEQLKRANIVFVNYADEVFPLLAARCLGKPSVLATHALHTVWARELRSVLPWLSYHLRLAYSFVTDFISYALADVVLVTFEQEKRVALQTWKHLTEDRVKVLVNAVDAEILKPDPVAGTAVRQRLGIPASAVVVGFTSGMKELTNLETARYILQKLTREVWQDFPGTYFLIVGGHAPGSLKSPDDERVVITGFVDDLLPYLNAIDISIAPYKVGRGAKLKMVEAMACGKVVVATPQGIGGFDVTNGENALVCEFDDFLQTLKYAIANHATIKDRMGKQARTLVEERYSWQRVGLRLTDILEGLVARRREE
jgi:glycosyltransferase involved in cell wall biosynthesis